MMNRELFHYMSSNNDITRVVVQMHKKILGFRKAFRCPYNILEEGDVLKFARKMHKALALTRVPRPSWNP